MSAERDWVETVKQDIETSLAHNGVAVRTGYRCHTLGKSLAIRATPMNPRRNKVTAIKPIC
jgi:hypothetical protein